MFLAAHVYQYLSDIFLESEQEQIELSTSMTSSSFLTNNSAACVCSHPIRASTPPPILSTTPLLNRQLGVAFESESQSHDNIPAVTNYTKNNENLDKRLSLWGSAGQIERRPSAIVHLGNCSACGEQRKFLVSILRNAQQHQSRGSAGRLAIENNISSKVKVVEIDDENDSRLIPSYKDAIRKPTPALPSTAPPPPPPTLPILERQNSKEKTSQAQGDDALAAGLSALYAKLLFVLGIACPISEVISDKVPKYFDQGFYVYLYLVSIGFMIYMYSTLMKEKSVSYSVVNPHNNIDVEGDNQHIYIRRKINNDENVSVVRYGSFYLRAGAIAFGIGSMIFSGLEFGQYFEIDRSSDCHNVLLALTPALRMILTIMQIQFLFLNNRFFEMRRYRLIARFGLMHMLATNMCEWAYVLVEEAKHEILHLSHYHHHSYSSNNHYNESDDSLESSDNRIIRDTTASDCMRSNIMGTLVQNASPFLFPCTIEYSLICAVILYEMWKNVNSNHGKNKLAAGKLIDKTNDNHFSVDCASAHRGLFSGIIILVITIISLIMFFVLIKDPLFSRLAVFEVNICEIVMYIATTIAVLCCMKQMRELEYKKGNHGFELDGILIVVAQTGMYVYCLFSIIGSYFSDDTDKAPGGLFTELFALIQTTCQTIFILDAWWRRSENFHQIRRKPGRQLITFLLIANLAMWTINALEKNRAEFHPTHLDFYGVWAWTFITHVSMPLAVFYRFHSTVCLLEIWKTAYKLKHH